MTFLTVLLTLFVERFVQRQRPQREHRWFDHYCRRLAGIPFTQWLMTRRLGAVALVLPPLLLIAWLQTLFNGLSSLLGLIFGFVILLYSLGPRELGTQVESFLTERDRGNEGPANSLADELCPGGAPDTEPQRSYAVASALVVAACTRLVAPIFWFVVFGAVGAAAYRIIQLLGARLQCTGCPDEMQAYSDEMRHIADWAPARITVAGYAIAGNFDAVAHAWQVFDHVPDSGPIDEAERLLAKTGLAALDTYPNEAEALDAELAVMDAGLLPPVVEDALALVWRSLAVWLAVLAAGSLVAALA
jgi:membrane protein required for beta-lactamase induction